MRCILSGAKPCQAPVRVDGWRLKIGLAYDERGMEKEPDKWGGAFHMPKKI